MINSQFFCNIIIQVTIIFIFLSVFYFTYAKNKEADVVMNNVDFLLKHFIGQGKINFLTDDVRTTIKSDLTNNTTSDGSIKADKDVEKKNKDIIKKTIKTVITVVVSVCCFVLFCFIMNKRGIFPSFFTHLEFKEIFSETLIIIIFVALTEFCFLKFFGSKFISIDPNKIKVAFLKNLQNYANSN